jgi:mannose-6-phosphate isomerase-like protein (cupin superfamily)
VPAPSISGTLVGVRVLGEDLAGQHERGRMAMTSSGTDAYSVASREDAIDVMADYPGYGEQRWYTSALAAEQVSFSWRRMLPGTGGRGSYGHRHPDQEEIYFVISGVVTFKIGDDVFEAGPKMAVRVGGDAFRSIHNDTDGEAELLIVSTRLDEPKTETQDGFWTSP